jgi:HK97 gp10 family phage protein
MRKAYIDGSNAKRRLKELSQRFPDATGKAIERGAKQITEVAKRNCPVRTGYLKSTIKYWMIGYDEAKIVADAPYAAFVEFGTRYMAPRYYMTRAFEEVAPRLPSYVVDAIRGEVG